MKVHISIQTHVQWHVAQIEKLFTVYCKSWWQLPGGNSVVKPEALALILGDY